MHVITLSVTRHKTLLKMINNFTQNMSVENWLKYIMHCYLLYCEVSSWEKRSQLLLV